MNSIAEAIKEFRDDRPNLRIYSPRGIQIKHIVSRHALSSLGINGDGRAIVTGDRPSIVLLLFGEPPFEPSQHSEVVVAGIGGLVEHVSFIGIHHHLCGDL